MGCVGTARQSEFEFIASLRDRQPEDCRGPLFPLGFSGYRLELLEESLLLAEARDRLWDGYLPGREEVAFVLCAAHWMDLSYISGVCAQHQRRADWFDTASALLRQIFLAARWDPKEIANMVTWQRVQLT